MIAIWIVTLIVAIASVVWLRTYWAAFALALGWLGWMAWISRHAWSSSTTLADAVATVFFIVAVLYLLGVAVVAVVFAAGYFRRQAEIDDQRREARRRYDEIYGPDGGIGDWPFYIPPRIGGE